jgi:hypothetical protein
MSDETVRLPAMIIPVGLHDLLRLYGYKRKLSVSATVRELLKNSPELIELAKQEGIDLGELTIGSWGGKRQSDEEDEDAEPSMAVVATPTPRLAAPVPQGWQGRPSPKPK